jgi:predicted nucleic acid-binding Zn ribbon protein
MRRQGPRLLKRALEQVAGQVAPATTLARVQSAWREVAGPVVAEEAEPVSERAGVVTVSCRSAVWAQELELLSDDLAARLNEALGGQAVKSLRLVASGAPTRAAGRRLSGL